MNKTGILLTNIGTPDAATPQAVRHYLAEFLSDPRVVELPPWLWWPILHGIILRTRPQRSAKLYQKIWMKEGSPLLVYSKNIATKLQKKLGNDTMVELGMHYGNPSIKIALEKLQAANITDLIILPLFPQYSATTTASTFDKVTEVLKTWRKQPALRMINQYATHPDYIHAICQSIQAHPRAQHLLFSFHGIPQQCVNRGDPYPLWCQTTVKLIAKELQLQPRDYSIAFQSRLGYAKWLTPYTDQILQTLPKQGVTDLQVICPGFAVDCLETLEEMNIRGREQFLEAGGKSFHYISALNDTEIHSNLLANLLI